MALLVKDGKDSILSDQNERGIAGYMTMIDLHNRH